MAAPVPGRRVRDGLHRPLRVEHAAGRRLDSRRGAARGHRRLICGRGQQAAQEGSSLTMSQATEETIPLPAIPVSAGALIFDRTGRLLILKPTYKSGWTIPGGIMEADGESPWEACQREVREETGIAVSHGRLAAMDFRRPRPDRPGGIRFLFDCGQVSDAALADLKLQP